MEPMTAERINEAKVDIEATGNLRNFKVLGQLQKLRKEMTDVLA